MVRISAFWNKKFLALPRARKKLLYCLFLRLVLGFKNWNSFHSKNQFKFKIILFHEQKFQRYSEKKWGWVDGWKHLGWCPFSGFSWCNITCPLKPFFQMNITFFFYWALIDIEKACYLPLSILFDLKKKLRSRLSVFQKFLMFLAYTQISWNNGKNLH